MQPTDAEIFEQSARIGALETELTQRRATERALRDYLTTDEDHESLPPDFDPCAVALVWLQGHKNRILGLEEDKREQGVETARLEAEVERLEGDAQQRGQVYEMARQQWARAETQRDTLRDAAENAVRLLERGGWSNCYDALQGLRDALATVRLLSRRSEAAPAGKEE